MDFLPRVALFVLEHDDSREWVAPLASQLGVRAVVPKRASLALMLRESPDLIVFDCGQAVPTQWVQLMQDLRQTPLFESTPVVIATDATELPAAIRELPRVTQVLKPFTVDDVIAQLHRLGSHLRVERRHQPARVKSEKFRILDSPSLLEADLRRGPGRLGCAVLYLDIDHFKRLNTMHLERVVDRAVLAPFQQLLAELVVGNGHAYAEGGDEVVMLLPNADEQMALAFAKAVLEMAAAREFTVEGHKVTLTVSIGVAVGRPGADVMQLPDIANEAKRRAKEEGRNRLVLLPTVGGPSFAARAAQAPRQGSSAI